MYDHMSSGVRVREICELNYFSSDFLFITHSFSFSNFNWFHLESVKNSGSEKILRNTNSSLAKSRGTSLSHFYESLVAKLYELSASRGPEFVS